jgi:hypothetical protein
LSFTLDLIPVALAARMVYQRAYGVSPPDAHLMERLNGLAYRLASLGGVYALDARRGSCRRLRSRELACGHFRNGGSELHFLNERAPILQLGVTKQCIEKVVDALLGRGL